MQDEIWKDVAGLEKWFEVSNKGRVRSKDRLVNSRWGNDIKKPVKGKIMSQRKIYNGYYCVHLHVSEINYNRTNFVHRLVAQAFINNPNNLPQVNHIDENKENNCVENLEWCTAKENNLHGNRSKKVLNSQRKRNKHFTGTKIVQLDSKNGNVINIWDSMSEAVRQCGFSLNGIYSCCNGRILTHRGFKFMYFDDYKEQENA